MKRIALFLCLCVGTQAGIVRLVTPPVVQKTGSFAKKHTAKLRHFVWKAIW